MLASTVAVAAFAVTLFAQAVPAPVDGPVLVAPGGGGTTTTHPAPNVTNNVTNVWPSPPREEVIATESEAAPVILLAGFRGIDMDAAGRMGDIFKFGLGFSQFRTEMLDLPVVKDINRGMTRIVQITLALVIAALAMWGILSRYVGSDIREAFETLGRVPLWAILAMTSLQWYRVVLQGFAQLSGAVATSGSGAFGPSLRPDFWSNAGLGLFGLLIGLFMLVLLLMFVLEFWKNTAFLLVAAVVAPMFVFMKATPWTQQWGNNWFKMVPSTALDTVMMLCILLIGAAGFDHITAPTAFVTVFLDLGLLMCLPLVRKLFGLEHHSSGSKLFAMLALSRMVGVARAAAAGGRGAPAPSSSGGSGGGGGSGAGGSGGGGSAGGTTSPTTPTRAPRWSTPAYTRALPESAGWKDDETDHGVGPVRWAQAARDSAEDPQRITTRNRRMNDGARVVETERMAG